MSKRESWMPSEEEIKDALLTDGFYDVHQSIAALVRRAAAKRALEELDKMDLKTVRMEMQIAALKRELETT